jgi:hypothetical protein
MKLSTVKSKLWIRSYLAKKIACDPTGNRPTDQDFFDPGSLYHLAVITVFLRPGQGNNAAYTKK